MYMYEPTIAGYHCSRSLPSTVRRPHPTLRGSESWIYVGHKKRKNHIHTYPCANSEEKNQCVCISATNFLYNKKAIIMKKTNKNSNKNNKKEKKQTHTLVLCLQWTKVFDLNSADAGRAMVMVVSVVDSSSSQSTLPFQFPAMQLPHLRLLVRW